VARTDGSDGANPGPYEIVSPLGVGALGEVYRARLGRAVALKIRPGILLARTQHIGNGGLAACL
jgi:hypothetical protein